MGEQNVGRQCEAVAAEDLDKDEVETRRREGGGGGFIVVVVFGGGESRIELESNFHKCHKMSYFNHDGGGRRSSGKMVVTNLAQLLQT